MESFEIVLKPMDIRTFVVSGLRPDDGGSGHNVLEAGSESVVDSKEETSSSSDGVRTGSPPQTAASKEASSELELGEAVADSEKGTLKLVSDVGAWCAAGALAFTYEARCALRRQFRSPNAT